MNRKVLFAALLSFIMLAMPAWADAPQEVTLTVSSDGPTKEDATKNALRSAIEQAYGAFVSAILPYSTTNSSRTKLSPSQMAQSKSIRKYLLY